MRANILEPKNQKVTYGRYFTEENYKNVSQKGDILVGNNTSDPNTPRAPSGPKRIEAGTARVPLRALKDGVQKIEVRATFFAISRFG